MMPTPWGAGETPRQRLFAATVAVVSEKGYHQTSVADLIERADVSRATFYRQFADKQACVLATVDEISDMTEAVVRAALAMEGDWEQRARAGIDAFVELVVTYPTSAHLCLIDLWATGPAGSERTGAIVAQLEAPFRAMLEQSPARSAMPPEITRAIVGGIYKTLHGRVRRGEQAELATLGGAIYTWAAAYEPPPTALPRARPAPSGPTGPQFAAHGEAGRLFTACVAEVAERGYGAVTIDDLARRAQMSLQTVYSLFAGKEEILLATYDAGVAQGEAIVMPAYARHLDSWPHAVRAGLEALLCHLAGDPAWARMSIVETLGGGSPSMERTDRVINTYATLLEPGLEHNPDLGPIALEASAGAIYTLIYEQVLRADPRRLPEPLPLCTYVALAPFVGPDEALAVADCGSRTRRRTSAPSAHTGLTPSAASESSAT